ncbi:MAG TPA: multicopper oxidase domain-containing protein [Micromonosporaceae bacterium]
MSTSPSHSDGMPPRGPLGGIAAGVALVLLAVLIGVVGQRVAEPAARTTADPVAPTGHTTSVEVTAKDMRFHPDHVAVPRGDRLVVTLRNQDDKRHDLVLANGAKTPLVAPGASARLDAGVIGTNVDGWCSVPGHRQAGMTLTVTVDGAPVAHGDSGSPSPAAAARIDPMADPGPGFTARDASLPPASGEHVHRVTLQVREVEREVSPGVTQKLWTFGGTAPGPVLHGHVGDVFEVTLVNDGSMEHSIDFHAGALAPDQPMRSIPPGQSLVYRFTAGRAGIWMYHCATMPMLEHVGNGMYGAVVIDPPGLAPVAHEYVLVQSELYLGAQGQPGDLAKMRADQPDAVVFNGYVSQYVHRPLTAGAGERVRFWVLDAGPNRASAFHVVGAQFDTVYKEGAYLLRPGTPGGAQELDLSPAGGGFVETVFPQPGHYPFLSHVLVDAERGARGVIEVTR